MNNLGTVILSRGQNANYGQQAVKESKKIDSTQKDKPIQNDFEKTIKEYDTRDKEEIQKETPTKKDKKIEKGTSVVEEKYTKAKEIKEEAGPVLEGNIQSVEAVITAILVEALQLTPEELESMLNKMNISPTDLLDEGVFRDFLLQLVPTEENSNLLLENGLIKDISKLWDKLSSLKEEVLELAPELLTPTENADTLVEKVPVASSNIEKSTATTQVKEGDVVVEIHKQILQGTDGTISSEQKTSKVVAIEEDQLVEEHSLGNKGEFLLQVPIQGLENTIGTKLWETKEQALPSRLTQQMNTVGSQIIEKLEINALREGKELVMELNPKELGRVALKITEHNGVVTANIRVETDKTKEMVLQNIEQLKEGLTKQGLTVGDFQVDVGRDSRQSEMHRQRQKSSKRIEELIAKHLQELEEVQQQVKVSSETEIDYMA